ncbi:hypothetical protein BDR26DRAFT_960113 [Obelidium mucronatum]|nr:hypothetical protein BDR26DRAFT_960113 [Obelidium mucronatum]
MDAVNHWKPVQPSVLVAPFSQCHRCTKNLTFSSTQVVVLGMEGPYYALLFKGNCTKCRMWYNVDSVANMSEDKQKQLIEMYLLETILSVGFLKINEQHYVTIPFADLWLKHLPSGLLLGEAVSQRSDLQTWILRVLLQQFISKIAANDDYEHMRYTHFRPSWAPKTTHLWNNSLFLGPYLPKTAGSGVTAATGATSFTTEKKSGSVMDGKVMEHLLCSVPGCVLPILGVNTLFCSSHAQLKNECIISGCKRKKTDNVLSTCGLSSHNATVQEIIGKQFLYKTVTFVVDRFHFRMHRDNFCTEHCDPAKFKELTSGGPANGKGRFNTSAAEHVPVQADFIMWCLTDLRNADIQNRISKKKRVIRNKSKDQMEAEGEQPEKDDEEDDEDTNKDDGEGVEGDEEAEDE